MLVGLAIASAFKDLNKANLIQEERQGRNKPNKIYVGKQYPNLMKNL